MFLTSSYFFFSFFFFNLEIILKKLILLFRTIKISQMIRKKLSIENQEQSIQSIFLNDYELDLFHLAIKFLINI